MREDIKTFNDYFTKLGWLLGESEEIVKRAIRKAELREEEIIAEANQKAARVLERAEEQIELEKKKAINDVKDEVSGMAVSIAAAVIGRDVKGDEHKELIDSFVTRRTAYVERCESCATSNSVVT